MKTIPLPDHRRFVTTTISTLPLPERGITCLPPWPQAKAFSDKRLENRGYGVARQIGEWRGLMAVSQSKGYSLDWRVEDAEDMALELEDRCGLDQGVLGRRATFAEWAGRIPLVAELVDVLPPERCVGDPWHVPGQYGLILGRVWLVEPVPCTGGVGCWEAEWCIHCGHTYANVARIPDKCYTCKRKCAIAAWSQARPELKVIKECVI